MSLRYGITDPGGTPIGDVRDDPIYDLHYRTSYPDGSRYSSWDPSDGSDHTVIQVMRGGVWHRWEPPLGEAQEAAYHAALRGESVFITGPGGCGKSEVVRRIIRDLRFEKGKNVAITASTGLAAVNVGGTTLHSFLGTGLSGSREQAQRRMNPDMLGKAADRIMPTDTIVVDEVSMLTGDFMDMASWWMNLVSGDGDRGAPFAGKQMIFVGDFLQLPPVIKPDDKVVRRYAFDSLAWAALNPVMYALLHNFRQANDEWFRKHLLRIRRGAAPPDTLEYFNSRVMAPPADAHPPTQVYPTNREADKVNDQRLHALGAEVVALPAVYAGHPKWQEALKRNLPCDDPLELAVGAEVMCTYNNPDGGYINGTRGVVTEFVKGGVLVKTHAGATLQVVPTTWDMRNHDDRVLASVTQFPLRLAWALTIHKCQGATLDAMVFDPSRVFERAQAYVALSRVRSMEGLWLASPLKAAHVRASARVVEWYRGQRDRAAALEDAARSAAGDP